MCRNEEYYGEYEGNTKTHEKHKRYDEDHQCDVYDFVNQVTESQEETS